MSTLDGTTMHPRCRSMVQTCRKIKVHVANTDVCLDLHESLYRYSVSKQAYLCAKYKLKIVYKT